MIVFLTPVLGDEPECAEELRQPPEIELTADISELHHDLFSLSEESDGVEVDTETQAIALAARTLSQGAVARCKAGDCDDELDKVLNAAAETKWESAKLLPQRLLFISGWVTTVFMTSTYAFKLGNQSGNGTGFAIAAATISTAIYSPLANAFLFRLAAFFQKLGHRIWGGKDIYSQDKKVYDERQAFNRGQLINIRVSLLPNLHEAVRDIQAGRPETAAAMIAEGIRANYRLFRGVNPNEETLLDMVESHFLKRAGVLPPEFFSTLERELFECKWKDYPARSRHCHALAQNVLKNWFNAPSTNGDVSVNNKLHGHGAKK
jgi:hypothetical protein